MADSRLEPVVLSEAERRTLTGWARRRSTAQGLAMRARIVLACAEGGGNVAVAARLRPDRKTVARWRSRFLAHRLDGLSDELRPGVPPHHHRCPGGGGGGAHFGRGAGRVHALVQAGTSPPGGHLADQRGQHLAGVRTAALAHRGLQDFH
ncbi:helix-turn-helix domain-containing protein [Nonomuraea jabiensis]|uniref:helix-turn-helix domain-containing protein n=1 Tax=Nonomuraea jabiensis TaxID=882448 RepID=UPI003D75743B